MSLNSGLVGKGCLLRQLFSRKGVPMFEDEDREEDVDRSDTYPCASCKKLLVVTSRQAVA